MLGCFPDDDRTSPRLEGRQSANWEAPGVLEIGQGEGDQGGPPVRDDRGGPARREATHVREGEQVQPGDGEREGSHQPTQTGRAADLDRIEAEGGLKVFEGRLDPEALAVPRDGLLQRLQAGDQIPGLLVGAATARRAARPRPRGSAPVRQAQATLTSRSRGRSW